MKKLIISFAYIFAMVLLLVSCDESAIDPLTGKYPAPETYALTNLFSQTVQKQDKGTRIFTLKMTTDGVTASYNASNLLYTYSGSGKYLSVEFVSKDYYLAEGSYTIAINNSAKAGNFIAGYDGDNAKNLGTCFFDINNGTETGLKVESGSILVTKSDNNYTISGTLTLSDLTVIRVSFVGVVIYVPDPEPVKPIELTNVFAATATAQTAGYQLITLKISVTDVKATYNAATYSYTYTGSGNYISVDLLSNSATIDPGTYTPANNGEGVVGNFISGYDTEMWGMKFYNWGSCWFTVDNGTEKGQHLISGSIVVAKSGSTYTISITGKSNNGDDVFAEYIGEIKQLAGSDDPVDPEVSYTYSNTTSEVSTYDWATGVSTVYEGVTLNKIFILEAEGDTIAAFEAVTASDATTLAGDYKIVENPTKEGQMNNGWSLPAYNMSGGSYFIKNAVKWYIKGGTVTISEDTNGILTISGIDLTLLDDASTSKTGSFSLSNIKK
jgi:hypothetical protein